MDADLDTLATALYARVDDVLKDRPELAPWRPKVGIIPKLSDAELLTLAVMQVLQGFNEEARCSATLTNIFAICLSTCLVRPGTTSGSGSPLDSCRR